MRTLLIDTDALIWRFSLINRQNSPENPFGFAQDTPDLSDLECAQRDFQVKLDRLSEDYAPCKLILCLPEEGTENFRYKLYPQYKGHRGERPEIVTQMYQWVHDTYKDILHTEAEVETDDIIADLAYNMPFDDRVIVSNDKDFRQIPGWHLHPFTGYLEKINNSVSLMSFWRQVLMGDSADGIPGCPGIGETIATRIILGAVEQSPRLVPLEDVVLTAYLTQGATFEDFALNYRLILLGNKNYRYVPHTLPEAYIKVIKRITKS